MTNGEISVPSGGGGRSLLIAQHSEMHPSQDLYSVNILFDVDVSMPFDLHACMQVCIAPG